MADIISLARYRTADIPGDAAERGRACLLRRWRDRMTLRRMLRDELLRQPDSVLTDAGWTRDAARNEASKPFWRL